MRIMSNQNEEMLVRAFCAPKSEWNENQSRVLSRLNLQDELLRTKDNDLTCLNALLTKAFPLVLQAALNPKEEK